MRSARHPHRSRGLTLVELMIALAVTGMIGVAIVAMLSAVAYGSEESRDLRKLVARNKVLGERLAASIRGARQVLATGDGYMVLWMRDSDGNGVPNFHELRRLQLVGDAAGTFASYCAASDAPNTEYDVTEDFDAVTNTLMDSGDFPRETWATGVQSWEVELDAAADVARLVSYRFTLATGRLQDTAIGAVSLRVKQHGWQAGTTMLAAADSSEGSADSGSGSDDDDDWDWDDDEDDDDHGGGHGHGHGYAYGHDKH